MERVFLRYPPLKEHDRRTEVLNAIKTHLTTQREKWSKMVYLDSYKFVYTPWTPWVIHGYLETRRSSRVRRISSTGTRLSFMTLSSSGEPPPVPVFLESIWQLKDWVRLLRRLVEDVLPHDVQYGIFIADTLGLWVADPPLDLECACTHVPLHS